MMKEEFAEVYCNTYFYACRICDGTFSRGEVRNVKIDGDIEFVCDHCYSLEINADEIKEAEDEPGAD